MTAVSIAHLRIKLDDVEPAVVRRVEVPLTIRLDRLHLVLQAAMGWTNSHLYEIRAGDVSWGRPDPCFGDGPLDASKARLVDVLEDVGTRSLKYLYDFGDGWEHSVRIERHHRCHARHRLPAPHRSSRTLSARGCRRPLGIP
jgi:Plasmid pRiA4b ORF-3-like protein